MVRPADVVQLPSLDSFSCDSIGNFKFSLDEELSQRLLAFIDNFYSFVATLELRVRLSACVWVVFVALDAASLLKLQNCENEPDIFLDHHAPESFHSVLFRSLRCDNTPVSQIERRREHRSVDIGISYVLPWALRELDPGVLVWK